MTDDDWEKAKKIFAAAIKLAPDERLQYLDDVCADETDIRREIESLLASYDEAESFMETPAVGEVAEIIGKENFENEATKVYFANETSEIDEEELPDAPDENALRPNRLRLSLIVLLVIFTAGWTLLNFGLLSVQQTERQWGFSLDTNANGNHVIVSVQPSADDRLSIGDELISLNGAAFSHENFLKTEFQFKAGDRYNLEIRRKDQSLTVELVALPGILQTFNRYGLALFFPAVLLIIGGAVFLLKPNDKAVLLLVVAFCLAAIITPPTDPHIVLRNWLPSPLVLLYYAATVLSAACSTAAFHFFLIFPERLPLVRRFPALEYLLYLPCLLFILVPYTVFILALFDLVQIDFNKVQFLLPIITISAGLYVLAALAALLFNYFQATETNRRRIRLIAVGFAVVALPSIIFATILIPLGLLPGEWILFLIKLSPIIFPFILAYAIVRHKVIPVSLVIRRGMQYILAKNGLRLLLVLPILGVIWNIAANPNRTVHEILLNNSFAFYSFLAVAAGFFLLMRLRFSDWIDRRFFREQYNQEKILRELIDEVKQFDSMPKLARFFSSRIQSALHPTSVYLFYRDDAHQSDFSLGYTTSGAGASSANLKLAAESPLLRFMQQERGAIEFPNSRTDDLPVREKRWLRETGANVLVPMHGTDGKLAGIFTLGEKMSQIPYTTRDKELLETLANQIALVHENLNLKDRVRREQRIKNEVLSRFDEGNINLLKECPKCGRCFDRDTLKCADDNSELTFSLPVTRTIENRYRLEKLLGKGGMGAVYQATDTRINRPVAVKILSGAMFGNKDALRRFEREAQTAGKLNHRNIVTVFDYGILSTEGAFLVMELVRGETLSEVLKRKGKLDARTVVAWFGQVLDGVEAAHKAGIVHRDLKPDNIFVTRGSDDETVRLCILDFGLARFNELEFTDSVTVPGTIMGTLGYIPPEQLRGEKTDERSDLFATSVIIYEALHGEKPFAGKSYQEIMRSMSKKIIFDEDETFTKFFERGLAQKPEKRFASANEMKGNLSNSSSILKTI